MRFLIRVFLLFIVVSTVLSMIRNAFGPSRGPREVPRPVTPEPEPQRRTTSGHLVKDPVCGTYIPEDKAIRAHGMFFCSEECRKKYAN